VPLLALAAPWAFSVALQIHLRPSAARVAGRCKSAHSFAASRAFGVPEFGAKVCRMIFLVKYPPTALAQLGKNMQFKVAENPAACLGRRP